ncbi:MAG: flippase-like domain-containing protein [Nitrospirae bacterium]|nr:MAG: flippase-like domain-containing protein [Nitrospirota bacterium]
MARKLNKIVLLILKLAVSSGLLYLVLSKAGAEKVLAIITTINPAAFIFSILLYLVSLYVSTMRWRLLLPVEFRKKKLLSFYMIGSFFSTFLPGVIGGDAVKGYYLYKETNNGSLSLASVFMDRYIGFVSLMIMGLIAYIAGFNYLKGSIIEWLLPAIILAFVIGNLVIFGLRFGKRMKRLAEFYAYFDKYRNHKTMIAKTLFLSFIVQIINIISIYIITLGLGQHISLVYFFIFFPIITTISTLPISISGLGLRESSFVLLFGLPQIGIKPEMATAMSFAWFLSTAFGGLCGLFEYLRLKR